MPTGSPGQQRARPTVAGPPLAPRTPSSPRFADDIEAANLVTVAHETYKFEVLADPDFGYSAGLVKVPRPAATELTLVDRIFVHVGTAMYDSAALPGVWIYSSDLPLGTFSPADVFDMFSLEEVATSTAPLYNAAMAKQYEPAIIIPPGQQVSILVLPFDGAATDRAYGSIQYRRAVVA